MQSSGIKICDLTPFSAQDFPDRLSAILWFCGCNMRCPYCHNPEMVMGKNSLAFDEVLRFLRKRKGLLEGVVLSGGEPTLHPHLLRIVSTIRSLGYRIKLDTNGSNPKTLQMLIESRSLDYVALDIKATKKKFEYVTKSGLYEKMRKSLEILLDSGIDFEVRTTVHSALLTKKDLLHIANMLERAGFGGVWYIQNFVQPPKMLGSLPSHETPQIDLGDFAINVALRNF